MTISDQEREESLQRQREYMLRREEFDRVRRDKRELRRKEAKRKAKNKEVARKQRKLDRLLPRGIVDPTPHSVQQSRDNLESLFYPSGH